MMIRLLLVCVTALVLASAVRAQTFAYEGFDYATSQSINGLGGGTGWATAWSTTTTTSFVSYTGSTSDPTGTLITSGNQVRTVGTTTFHELSRSTAVDLRTAPNSSLWISLTARRIDPFSSPTYGGLVIGNEVGSSAANTGRLFVGDPGGADTWAIERAGGGGPGQVSNHSVVNGAATLLVVNIQFQDNGPETVSLYVNRAPGGGTPPSVDAFLSNLDLNPSNGPVTNVSLWFAGSIYQFDEIRIGTSYADVTPTPEPGALLVVAAGVLSVGAWRRRRSLSRSGVHAPSTAR
jgi:MYXO-CTERM domain-containing protein